MPDESGGTVYLLHLDPPLKHARHYTGWTSNLDQRLDAHRKGRGARLMEVVKEAGGTFRLVRTWPGDRSLERAIKDRKEAPKLCPECTPQPAPVTRGRSAGAARPGAEASPVPEAATVPEPDPEARWMPFPGRPAGPEAYAEALPLTDGLIARWRAQLDNPAPAPEPEAELELEPLPPARKPVPAQPAPTRRNSQWASGTAARKPLPPRSPRRVVLRQAPALFAEREGRGSTRRTRSRGRPLMTPGTPAPEGPIADDHLLAYVTYHPSPYDAGVTDDPELRWDQVPPEPEPEASL